MSRVQILTCSCGNADVLGGYLAGYRGLSETKQQPHRALSLLAWDTERQKVVGYLSVDGKCAAVDCKEDAAKLSSIDAPGLGYSSSSSAFVHCVQVDEDKRVPVTLKLLQAAFTNIPNILHLLLVSHSELQPESHAGLSAYFSKAMHSSDSGLWLYECNRKAVLPTLQVRRAKVEDHDDLLPVVAAAAAGSCPSLAALPDSCRPDEPYALTRLIGNQDSQNVALVAHDQGSLVGLLVATTQLDVSLLHESFDLGPFDGFLPAEVYEECEAAAQAAAIEKAQERHQQMQMQDEQHEPEAAEVGPTADDVREELLPLLVHALQQGSGGDDQPRHSLLAITMLCMLPGYEARAAELLQPLFHEFKGKDYCALSLPHNSPQPPLARLMSRLAPLPASPYPEELMLVHRAALLQHVGALQVRLAEADDVVGLHRLIGSLSNAVEVQEAFLHALSRQGAVVAVMQGEVVGMAATTPTVNLQLLKSNFQMEEALPVGCCDEAQEHAELDVCVINPIFAKIVGIMLAGALQLTNKKYLHYALLPGHPVPDCLCFMQQQQPRHNIPTGATVADFSLFSFTKHMAYAPKQTVNTQIVVAGASEAALSCLEQLLVQPHMNFTNLMLLAPGGVSVGGVASSYTASLVARMGLEASVTIVDGHMTAIDTVQKSVQLADGNQLSYDLLLVTTGLQDQLGPAIAGACPESSQFVMSSQQLINGSITPEAAAGLTSVLLYGADLQAYEVVAALTEAGMPADAITWVCPDQQQEDPMLPLLLALAAQMQLDLPTPQSGQLLELTPTEDGMRAVAALQAAGDTGPPQQLELDLLVGCGRRGPSAAVARCLGGAGLVWDGRLVVDASYRSNDPAVMGAGSAAKFSRRYTLPEVMLEHYSSTEVGASLAASIIHSLAEQSPAPGSPSSHRSKISSLLPQGPDQLPPLHQGKLLGCRLPGGQVFAFAGSPAAVAKPGLAPPPGGRSLISKHLTAATAATAGTSKEGTMEAGGETAAERAGGVINICLDGEDIIHYVAYLGSQAPAAAKLAGLVGLPFSYLAAALELPARETKLAELAEQCYLADSSNPAGAAGTASTEFDGPGRGLLVKESNVSMRGLVGVSSGAEPGVYVLHKDILAELSRPWAQLLFHDEISNLRYQLLQQCSQVLKGDTGVRSAAGDLACTVEGKVDELTVQLLQKCSSELQGYSVGAPAVVTGPNMVQRTCC